MRLTNERFLTVGTRVDARAMRVRRHGGEHRRHLRLCDVAKDDKERRVSNNIRDIHGQAAELRERIRARFRLVGPVDASVDREAVHGAIRDE